MEGGGNVSDDTKEGGRVLQGQIRWSLGVLARSGIFLNFILDVRRE